MGWTENNLSFAWSVHLTFKQTEQKFEFDLFFCPWREHVVGSIRAFDAGSGVIGRSSVLLLGAASLSVSAPEL